MNERKFSLNSRETEQLTTSSISYVRYESLIQNEEKKRHKIDHKLYNTDVISTINSFLNARDNANLKRTCRFFYNQLDTVSLTAEQLLYFFEEKYYFEDLSKFSKLEKYKEIAFKNVINSLSDSLKSLNCILNSEYELSPLLNMSESQLQELKTDIQNVKANKGKNCIPVAIRSCTSNSCLFANVNEPCIGSRSEKYACVMAHPLCCSVCQSVSCCCLSFIPWGSAVCVEEVCCNSFRIPIPFSSCDYCNLGAWTFAGKLTAVVSCGLGAVTGCIMGTWRCYQYGTKNVEQNAKEALKFINDLLRFQNINRVLTELECSEKRTLSI